MEMIEVLKVIFLGIVEGISEWLPISSTGHMILVDEFIKLNASEAFMEFFLVVIQLGAIMAVVVIYFWKLLPLKKVHGKVLIDHDTMSLWYKIVVACVPAAIIGILFDDIIDAMFYNPFTVACTLIIYGVLFIIVEKRNKDKQPQVTKLSDVTYKLAFYIGIFQLLALIPGTSRSGATILGGILVGMSRTVAAEFTFFLAIPVMFGASLLKVLKFGFVFTSVELFTLGLGMFVAFIVSIISIKFLMQYIKRNDFTVFGWYRIILGIMVLGYFFF